MFRPRSSLHPAFEPIIGDSPALLAALDKADLAAETGYPMLITGETGTGKSALGQAIHSASDRRGPFVALNCAALPATLLESELFGHMRGSFTGAVSDRAGLFERADGGTLFLDEIGDLAPEAQAKLLRALDTGRIRRIGGDNEVAVDARLIGATHQPLETRIAEGRFREDLYYRVQQFVVHIPPLRERRDDVPLLARHFLREAGAGDAIAPATLDRLKRHGWPGNVRELQAVMRQALVAAGGKPIEPGHLPALGPAAATVPGSADTVDRMRRALASPAERPRWARLFLGLAESLGSPLFTRRDALELLQQVRGPDAAPTRARREWEEGLRQQFLDTGLVHVDGKKLRVDLDACRRVLDDGPTSDTEPMVEPVPAPVPAATPVGPDPVRGNLPQREPDLIGRDAEIEALMMRIERGARLVTLTGPGGIGKTSLATAAGIRLTDRLAGGVWFVDLTEARTVDDVVVATASALGLQLPPGDMAAHVREALALRGEPLLLILDNFEQIVPAAPETVSVWLDAAASLRVVVTSRVVLNIGGEQTIELDPLAEPEAPPATAPLEELLAVDSVRLFVERARQTDPAFELTLASREPVVRILRYLGGMPLAIELAAARIHLFDVATLADRVQKRFDVLRSRRHDLAPHRRGLRDTLDWSFDLLTPTEQRVFAQCSTFRGGFTLEAAEAVLGVSDEPSDVYDLLQGLVDKSLLRRVRGEAGARLQMYVVIREYATERARELLDEATRGALADRHLAWFFDQSRAWLTDLQDGDGPTEQAARAAARDDRDNLRMALDRALDRPKPDEAAGIFAMVQAMAGYDGTGFQEVLFRRVEALADATDPVIYTDALSQYRTAAIWRYPEPAYTEPFRELVERVRAVPPGDDPVARDLALAEALGGLGFDLFATDIDASFAAFDEALELLRKHRCDRRTVVMMSYRGRNYMRTPGPERMLEHIDSLEELAQRKSLPHLINTAARHRVIGLTSLGRNTEAAEWILANEARVAAATRGWQHSVWLLQATTTLARGGEFKQSKRFARDGIALATAVGHLDGIASGLTSLGRAHLLTGEYEAALEAARAANEHLPAWPRAIGPAALALLGRIDEAAAEFEFPYEGMHAARTALIRAVAELIVADRRGDAEARDRWLSDLDSELAGYSRPYRTDNAETQWVMARMAEIRGRD